MMINPWFWVFAPYAYWSDFMVFNAVHGWR
jgi:hypothetical protein